VSLIADAVKETQKGKPPTDRRGKATGADDKKTVQKCGKDVRGYFGRAQGADSDSLLNKGITPKGDG
jgi:hypothetical protein